MSNTDGSRDNKDHSSLRGATDGERAAIEVYRGPLPPPHVMRAYKELDPDLYAIIVEEFKAEAKHRRDLERFEAVPARFLGLGFASAVFIGSGLLAISGLVTVPVAMVGAVGAVIGFALWARRDTAKDWPQLPRSEPKDPLPPSEGQSRAD